MARRQVGKAVKRYIGDAVITISYRDRGDYAGKVCVPMTMNFRGGGRSTRLLCWIFSDLNAPRAGFRFAAPRAGARDAYDSPGAYDLMAASAVSFGSYYTTHNRGDDVPEWAPEAYLADAIEEATSWAQDDRGEYEVRRSR